MQKKVAFMVKITHFMQKVQAVANSVNSESEVKNVIKSAKKMKKLRAHFSGGTDHNVFQTCLFNIYQFIVVF